MSKTWKICTLVSSILENPDKFDQKELWFVEYVMRLEDAFLNEENCLWKRFEAIFNDGKGQDDCVQETQPRKSRMKRLWDKMYQKTKM
jgi:hypothetical protein